MKKLFTYICILIITATTASCNDTETYAEKRDKEDAAISKFISRQTEVSKKLFTQPVSVISEIDFENAGYKTDVTKNEFVHLSNSGIYMQIVRKGCGEPIKSGETVTIVRITGKDEVRQHLAELGFVVGEQISVVSELGGNLIHGVVLQRFEPYVYGIQQHRRSFRMAEAPSVYQHRTPVNTGRGDSESECHRAFRTRAERCFAVCLSLLLRDNLRARPLTCALP